MHNFLKKDFRLGFRYTGKSGTGVALDNVAILCMEKDGKTPDGDYEDDSPPADNADGNEKNNQNCGLTFHDPAAPLALFMLLVGFVALLISRSRTK